MGQELTIIIPAYKDKDLQRTIDDIRAKAETSPEIIVILDGYEANINGATVVRHPKRLGMRASINDGAKMASRKYLLKCDAHCIFDQGFDTKLLKEIQDNWVVIPRRYKLDTDKWQICEDDSGPIDYERLVIDRPEKISGIPWRQRAEERKDVLIDETMVFQGSCWLMSKNHWDRLGGLQEAGYGTFTQEPIEIALKTWLGGGQVIVNKTTWYAHKHRKFKRTYHFNHQEIEAGNKYSQDFWLNNRWDKRIHDLDWLMKKFNLPL